MIAADNILLPACNFTEDELKASFATEETNLLYQWVHILLNG